MSYKDALFLVETRAAQSLTIDWISEVLLQSDSDCWSPAFSGDTNELMATEFNTRAHHQAWSALIGLVHFA